MEKVPKIVQERLRAATVIVTHPDADLLTAFSEQTLPERERGRVLDHLARCSECREVVALALPAEDAAVVEVRPARGGWLTWPRMRWVFVAAAVVAVASVGLVQFQLRSRQETVAKVYDARPAAQTAAQPANEAAKQTEPVPAAPQADKVEAGNQATLAVAPLAASAGKRIPAEEKTERSYSSGTRDKNGVSGGVVAGNAFRGQQLTHGPKMPTQFQQNMNQNANAVDSFAFQAQAPAPPPQPGDQHAANQLVVLPSASGSSIGGPLNDKQALDKIAVNGRLTAPLPAPGGSTGAEIARAKPASANAPQVAQTSEAYAVTVADSSNFSPSGSLAPESARWSINALGVLQRSTDQGRSWQDVDVNAASGKESDMELRMAMKSSRAKASGKDNANAKEKPIIFRAVSANGPDVWAGGSEGNLYHSADSGASWVRVLPSWRGIDLTGDILNLQFADPQHGRIVTSAAEIWTTNDAGQTWDKH